MARYGKKSQESVRQAMKKRKQGKLKSGRSGKTVRSRKQAIAIGLSEARKKGAKVPPPKGTRSKTTKSKSSSKSRTSTKTRRSSSKRRRSSKRSSSGRTPRKTTRRRTAASQAKKPTRTRAKASPPAPSTSRENITTDHEFIRRWVEERQGKPTRVKGTGGAEDPGILRIDFPDYSGRYSLEEIPWDEFFEKFEESGLAFLHQDMTAGGELSRFSKFISRDQMDKP